MKRIGFGALLTLCSGCYTTHVVSRAELAALDGFNTAQPAENVEVLVGDTPEGATIPLVRTTSPTPRKFSLLTGSDAQFDFGSATELTFVPVTGFTLARKFTSLSVNADEISGTTVAGEPFAIAASDLERVEVSRYSRGKTIALVSSLVGGGTVLAGLFIWVAIELLSPHYAY